MSALDSIWILWPFTHAVINFVIGCYATGILWLMLGTIPSILSAAILCGMKLPSTTETLVTISGRRCAGCDGRGIALRVVLIIFGVGLVAAPIPLPWSGPHGPFIRWQGFSVDVVLLWRGTFCNFAAHNWLAAADPPGRHRPYVAFMAIQGIVHATVMLEDNRITAARGQPNRNWEHAFEITGSLLLCSPPRPPRAADAGECAAAEQESGRRRPDSQDVLPVEAGGPAGAPRAADGHAGPAGTVIVSSAG